MFLQKIYLKEYIIITLAFIAVLAAVMILAKPNDSLHIPPHDRDYDLIVAGGEPEGIAAAIAAAREGLEVLLVCEEEILGGLYTVGELNMLDISYRGSSLFKKMTTQGFFEKFYKEVGDGFDVGEAAAWFADEVAEYPNIRLLTEAESIAPIMNGNRVTGIMLRQGDKEFAYTATNTVDATADADVAAAAGVPYSVGAEDYSNGDHQAVTLIFELSGVSREGVEDYVEACHKAGNMSVNIDGRTAYGYGPEALNYQPHNPDIRLRGPNIGFQKNGNVLINALLICNVNALDEDAYAAAIEAGKKELEYIIPFMRTNFPGFENCELVRTASRLYVRETRHIYGEYRLTVDDVLEHRDFADKIAIGAYPIDIQPTASANSGMVVGNPIMYSIPYRCTVPLEVENLWVVGRSASYDSLPHGSVRTVPIGICVGEAIGIAAAYAVDNALTPREICDNEAASEWLQKRLKKYGAYLPAINVKAPKIMSHWAYAGVRTLRSIGLLYGGYENDYALEEPLSRTSLRNLYINIAARCDMEQAADYFKAQHDVMDKAVNNNAAMFAAYLLNDCVKPADYAAAVRLLQDKGIIDDNFLTHFGGWEAECTRAEVCYILGNTYKYLQGENNNS